MSRKGKLPIPVPKGVEVKVTPIDVAVKGPKGTLHQTLIKGIEVNVKDNQIHVGLAKEHEDEGHYHGLYRTLILNMVDG